MLAKIRALIGRLIDLVLSAQPAAGTTGAPREVYLSIAELLRRSTTESETILDLTSYELRVFSQNGEDGVLAEILRRIGEGSRTFVEFGTEKGVQANCVYLADVLGWAGHFIEGDPDDYADLARKYEASDRVRTLNAFVWPERIEAIFADAGVPLDLDVLSIDVDGIDYWIWKALETWRPRVVVIEFNSALGRELLVQPSDQRGGWSRTEYYGASVTALAELGTSKGYRLVHADLAGANAFLVRDDLPGEFLPPDRVLLRAPNFDLYGRRHAPGSGPYVRPQLETA